MQVQGRGWMTQFGIDGAVWREAGGISEKAESTISLRRTVYPSRCEALAPPYVTVDNVDNLSYLFEAAVTKCLVLSVTSSWAFKQ
jgi:hypothetical protein